MQHAPAFQALCEQARQQITEISIADTRAAVEAGACILIDLREDHEVARGMVQGARHLGRGILERDIESQIPDKAAPIILYCGGGYRSALSAFSLQLMGYTNVKSMTGGWRGWMLQNNPVTVPS
jgi:rhodanese-related sulfurtransferase